MLCYTRQLLWLPSENQIGNHSSLIELYVYMHVAFHSEIRFRNTSPELELASDIVPPFRDDIQLSVAEYRSKLYEIMSSAEKAKQYVYHIYHDHTSTTIHIIQFSPIFMHLQNESLI